MKHQGDDESILHAFLLGQLPEAERTAIEERIFMDDLYVERLEMAEDELIDSYVEGALTETGRERFETFFLAPPRWQKKLRVAMAMHKYSRPVSLRCHWAVASRHRPVSKLYSAPCRNSTEPFSSTPIFYRRCSTALCANRKWASAIRLNKIGVVILRKIQAHSGQPRRRQI